MNLTIIGTDQGIGQRLFAELEGAEGLRLRGYGGVPEVPALAGCDVLVNCTTGAPGMIRAAAAAVFAAAARAATPPRVVQLSSMTVYGRAEGLIDEDAPLRDGLSAYASAQIAAERLAARYPRHVILRPGCEYGPGCMQWSGRVARWLLARRLGDLGETGRGDCNLLYVDDLVAALVAALRTPGIEGQAFNLASGPAMSWNDYFRRYAEALGALPLRRVTPLRLAIETKLFAPPLKLAELLVARLGGTPDALPPAIPPSLPRLCRQRIRLDTRRAETRLGLRWTIAEAGLRQAAAAFGARR